MKTLGWIRKWAADGEEPREEKRENGRWAWPAKFKLVPISQCQCEKDDIPLIAATPLALAAEELLAALQKIADGVRGPLATRLSDQQMAEIARAAIAKATKE